MKSSIRLADRLLLMKLINAATRTLRVLPGLALALAVLALAQPAAHAADGTWTNAATGTWSAGANWAGGTVADGSGFTANFNTLEIASDLIRAPRFSPHDRQSHLRRHCHGDGRRLDLGQ